MADTKPTLNVRWALTPAAASDVLDPSAQRAAGWTENSPLPYNNLNYLLQSVGEFAHFNSRALGPTNDMLTLTAVNGHVDLISDPANLAAGDRQEYRHVATGTNVPSRWSSDQINGRDSWILGEPEAVGFGRDNFVDDTRQLVKMGAVFRLRIPSGLVADLVDGLNCVSATINLGEDAIDLAWDEAITVNRIMVTMKPVRNGAGVRQAANEQGWTFAAEAYASGVRIRPYFFNGTNFDDVVDDWVAPARADWNVEIMVTVY